MRGSGHPRNTKGTSADNKIGLRNKCYLSPRQAAWIRRFTRQRSALVRRAALAWAGTLGVSLSTWVATWHILVRRPSRMDLFLCACAAILLVSVWMCTVGCRARYLLEQLQRRRR